MSPEDKVSKEATGTAQGPAGISKVRVDAENPWPGAEAYDEAASAYFYGRDRESRELLRLIKLAPLTVVYGKSGLGKTSLLQAGLFPLLRGQHFLPVLKRMDFEQPGDAPLEQIKTALTQALEQAQISYPAMEAGQSLWEYLHRKDAEFVDADGEAVIPVLVLDQFEELFSRTRGNDKIVQQVFFELADLMENRIPSELTGREARARRAQLDMLEQRYRLVLSFREDFIPMIRSWEKQVPSLLRNYLRLEPMSREQAIDAVNQAGAAVLEPDVAPDIVDLVGQGDLEKAASDTSDVVIEPVLLSLCCTQLNRRRGAGQRVDKQLVKDAGQDILESFYRTALEDPAVQGEPDAAAFIENYLIQGDRFRGDYPRKEALDEGKLRLSQMVALTDKHRLLRIINRGDTPRIELIHDRLVPVVKKARDERRLQAERAEQEEKARKAEQERDEERKRAAELKRERDRARLLRNLVALVCAVCVGVLIWGFSTKRKEKKTRAAKELAVETSRLAEGREALPGNSEPLDQAIYKALASYRLSEEKEMADALDPSLTAMELVLGSTGRLAKLVRLPGLKPTDAMKYSPDGNLLVVGGEDGRVWLLDAVNYRDTGRRLDCAQDKTSGYDGIPDYVWWVAFNRAGTRLAAVYASHKPGGGRALVCVFDMQEGKVVKRWLGIEHGQLPTSFDAVAYGGPPESEFLVFGGDDGILRKWELGADQITELSVPVYSEAGAPIEVASVALNRDESKLAVGGGDGVVQIWNTASWQKGPSLQPRPKEKHSGSIAEVEFSPEEKGLLVSGGEDGWVDVWNVEGKGCQVAESHRLTTSVESIAINARGVVAAGTGDGHVEFFRQVEQTACPHGEPATMVPIENGSLAGHGGVVRSVVFHPRERKMASVGQDGTIRFWARHTTSFAEQELDLHPESPAEAKGQSEIMTIAVSPDGTLVAAGDNKGFLHLWYGPKSSHQPRLDKNETPYLSWHAEEGGSVLELVFVQTRDGLLLVSAGQDGVVRRWRAGNEKLSGEGLDDPEDRATAIFSLALSPDGKTLAAGSDDGTVRLWNVESGKMVRKIPKPYASSYLLNAVGFSPDGRYLATGSDWDTQLRVIDLDSPDQKLKYWMLHGHTSGISRIAHGPKGPIGQEWLLSAGFSGSVLEWEESALRNNESSAHSEGEANSDIKRDEFKYRIGAPELRPSQPVTEVDVSMHGRFILTGGSKGQIELWDGTKHVLISDKFEGHTSDIRGAAFWGTGKDQLLFTADKDKILIWPGPDNWADILCKKLLWNMSDKQWRDWVSPDIPYKKQCPNLPKLASE